MNAVDFLQRYAANRTAVLPAELRQSCRPDTRAEFRLSGAGGGTFQVYWQDGTLQVAEGPSATPLVCMATDAGEFMAMMGGRHHPALDVTGPEAGRLLFDPAAFLTPRSGEILAKVQGTLAVQVCGGASPTGEPLSESFVAFRGEEIVADKPRCRVIIPIDQMVRVARGEIKPPQLMMSGGMRLIGDVQMVMLLAPLLS